MILRLGGLFFLVSVVFWLWAVFDVVTTETRRVRNLPKLAWIVIVLMFLEFGALAWVLFGRPRAGQPAGPGPGGLGGSATGLRFPGGPGWTPRRPGGSSPGGPRSRKPGPVGPDDDPDFLRGL